MDIGSMDPRTASLAIRLQLADIDDLLDSLYYDDQMPAGDARDGFQMLRRDLQQKLQVLEGQILTLQILKEEHENRTVYARLLKEEQQAEDDHKLAMELDGMAVKENTGGQSDRFCSEAESAKDDQWEMVKDLYTAAFPPQEAALPVPLDVANRAPLNGIRSAPIEKVKGSIKAKVATLAPPDKFATCCSCMELVSRRDTLTLRCQPEEHTYCRRCLVDLFTSSMTNTALFPPRCCRVPVPLDICRAMLPKALIKDFDLKVDELATPNPTYCSNAECSKFIRAKDIKVDVGTCAFCKDKTCTRCKCAEHAGLCPSDPHVQLLMDAAKRAKWQQCTKCNNMTELASGCFHMTCRCRHEFCYLCGAKWKTCTCPQWEEEYITRPVPVPIAAPRHGPAVIVPPVPAAAAAAPHTHDWRRVNGPACQGCGAEYLAYIMRCDGCNTDNCWRCIHNRD